MAPSAVLNLAVAPASRVFALSRRAWLRFAFTGVNAASTGLVLWMAWVGNWNLLSTVTGLSTAISVSYLVYFIAGIAAADDLIIDGVSTMPERSAGK
jgi:uncharacterized membrane protein YuzA (DUF378 family)